jgi:hypothetical protein
MDSARPAYRPPEAPKSHRHPTFVYWRRRISIVVAIFVVAAVVYYGVTLALALTNQSYGPSYSSRLAQWGRQHGLGAVVSWAQNEDYKIHPPKIGGTPPKNSFGSGPLEKKLTAGGHLPPPVTLLSPAGASLPGEGVWHIAGRENAEGIPSVYEAFLRADATHTSYVDAVVWMDPTLLSARLYSGSAIPGGGPYFHSAPLKAAETDRLVAAFDAGLPLSMSRGGYYTQGKVVAPLRKGAASVVVYDDGTMTVAKWGRDATMSNQVASVRQNLDLIVDNGQAVAGLATDKDQKWNTTLGPSDNVWRSGVGVTRNGAVLYVGGPGLSLEDLANIFVEADALRAMELSVGVDWVQYSTFKGSLNTPLNATNGTSVLSAMSGTPSRYFAPWWDRDFFTMSLRPNETSSASTSTTTTTQG